jgi:hypothetical protein
VPEKLAHDPSEPVMCGKPPRVFFIFVLHNKRKNTTENVAVLEQRAAQKVLVSIVMCSSCSLASQLAGAAHRCSDAFGA